MAACCWSSADRTSTASTSCRTFAPAWWLCRLAGCVCACPTASRSISTLPLPARSGRPERLGTALLVSLIDGAVKIAVNDATNTESAVILTQSANSSSRLAEEVLKSTINLPPILYKNQGGVVGVYVQRDLDFSTVYELRAQ